MRILVSRVTSLVFGKLKIAAGFYTVVVLFESVYALPFPSIYIRFISLFRVLDFFPALSMLKLNCVVAYSFYSVLHLSCSITFCLMLLIVANSRLALLPSTATLIIFFMLTMVYPSVSTIAFRTFNCRSVDGVSYLREDYSKECASESHGQAEQFASASIALVSVGLIVVYAALLWPHRAMLRTGATVTNSGDRKRLAELSFLYSDFKGPMFYWEVVDSTRKLLLTGVVVFMQEGSLVRPVWGMMICLGYMVLLLECKPYKAPEDNFLAVLATFALFLVLSGGLISAMTVGFVSTGEYVVGIENHQLGIALIACFLSVLVFGLGCVAMNISRVSASPLVRQAGAAVVVKALGDGFYHLFLSHTWGTGQNQMQALKKELQLLVPSMRVFLDVENLDSIGALEDLISKSETVLVFLSTGYFARWNCLREVHESIVRKKDIVLMREVAEMHGGGELSLVFNEIEHHKGLWAKLDEAHGDKAGTIDLQEALFGEDRGGTLLWHRVLEFKRAALKMLIGRVLQQQGVEHTGLSIPGELTLHRLKIAPLMTQQKYHLCLPQHESSSSKIEGKLRKLLQSMPSSKSFKRAASSSVSAQPVRSGDLSKAISSSFAGASVRSAEEQVKIGICGEGGCQLDNSSNLFLPMSTAAFANEALMHELRYALVRGVNVVAVHARDPAAAVEGFDEFISACPADIKSGLVLYQGREVQCPRLFDALAVDWFDAPGYTQVSLMLLLSKLQSSDSGKEPVAEDQLCDSLSAMGLEESSSNMEIAVVDVADI
jgi:hypothetical protein